MSEIIELGRLDEGIVELGKPEENIVELGKLEEETVELNKKYTADDIERQYINMSQEDKNKFLSENMLKSPHMPENIMFPDQETADNYSKEATDYIKNQAKKQWGEDPAPREIVDYNTDEDWTKFGAGMVDSISGMQSDIRDNIKGGSGYQTHDSDWDRKALTDLKKLKGVVQDLTYITGTSLADLPVILGLATASSLAVTPIAAPGVTMGGYSGIREALRTKRDMGSVGGADVAKETGKGFVQGSALGLGGWLGKVIPAGGLAKFAPNVLRNVAGQYIPAVSGFLGANSLMTASGLAMGDKKFDWNNFKTEFAMNVIPNLVQDISLGLGKKVAGKFTQSMIPTGVVDESTVNRQYSAIENERLYNEFADVYMKKNRDAENVPDEVLKEMSSHFDKIASTTKEIPVMQNKKIDPYSKIFRDAEIKKEFLDTLVSKVEKRTGQKSSLRDENGNWKEEAFKYFDTTDNIKAKIKKIDDEIGPESVYQENPSHVGTGDWINDSMKRLERLELENKLAKDDYLSKKVKEQKEELHGSTGKELKDKIKETVDIEKRRKLVNELLDELDIKDQRRRDIIEEHVTTTKTEKERLAKAVYYVEDAKKNGIKRDYKTTLRMLGMTGPEVERFIYQPARTGMAIVNDITNKHLTELERVSKPLSKKEKTEASLYALSLQKAATYKKDGTVVEKNIGNEIIKGLIKEGIIDETALKDVREMNEKQQDYIGHVMATYRQANKISNLSKELTDKDSIRALSDYVKLQAEKGDINLSDNDINAWLVNNQLKSKDVNKNYGTFKRNANGKAVNFELDMGSVLAKYLTHNNQVAIMSPIAQQMVDLGANIKKTQPELGDTIIATGNYISGNYYDPTPGKQWIHKFTDNIVASTLAAAFNTIVTQPTALITTMHAVGVKNTMDAISTIVDSKFNPDNDTAAFNRLKSDTLSYVVNDISEVQRQLLEKGSLKDRIIAKEFAPMRAFDMFTREITFEAAKQKKMKEGYSEDAAEYYADQIVAKTQATGSRIDNSPLQRTAAGKFMLAFQTYGIANLNYMVSDVLGADDLYKLVEVHKSKESAEASIAGKKGYEVKELTDGKKKTYATYEKKKVDNTISLLGKAAVMSIGMGITSSMFNAMKDMSPVSVNSPFPQVMNGIWDELYGYSFDDWMLGTKKFKDNRNKHRHKTEVVNGRLRKVDESDPQLALRVAGRTLQELSKPIPVVGSVLNVGSGFGGPISSVVNRFGEDFSRMMKSGKLLDVLSTANNVSTLVRNPFYQWIRQGINVARASNKAEVEKAKK